MNNYDNEDTYGQRRRRKPNPMATAALIFGILSIFLCTIFYVSIPCGAVAVICAILSRDNHPLAGRGKTGMICGIIGLAVSLVMTVYAFYYVLTTETGRSYLQYYYQYYTGDTDFNVNDALEEMFPFLGGSLDSTEDTEEEAAEEDTDAALEDQSENSDGSREAAPEQNQKKQAEPDQPYNEIEGEDKYI